MAGFLAHAGPVRTQPQAQEEGSMNREFWENTMLAGVAIIACLGGLAVFAALIGFFGGVVWSTFRWMIQ